MHQRPAANPNALPYLPPDILFGVRRNLDTRPGHGIQYAVGAFMAVPRSATSALPRRRLHVFETRSPGEKGKALEARFPTLGSSSLAVVTP